MGFFDFFRRKKKAPKEKTTDTPVVKKKKGPFSLYGALKRLFSRTPKLDQHLIENIRELLITADIGTSTTEKLIEKLKANRDGKMGIDKAIGILKSHIKTLLNPKSTPGSVTETPEEEAHIEMFVGVNGAGKTTSIAKRAHRLLKEGKKVMICAGDTFRAAAVEQIQIWGERLNVPVIIPTENHKAPAAVIYEALTQASKNHDDRYHLLIDTAGRLENKTNLMNELGKIKRVIQKKIADKRQKTYLVIDGSTGQEAWRQAEVFNQALQGISGLIVTKLDGVAKGGIVIRIVSELNIPIKYIGIGEKMEDLAPFDPQTFVDQLFENNEDAGP